MIFNMQHEHEQLTSQLPRTSSCSSTKRLIIPSSSYYYNYNHNYNHTSASAPPLHLLPDSDRRNHPSSSSPTTLHRSFSSSSSLIFSIFRSIINAVVPTTCRWLTIPALTTTVTTSLGRKVTGTLFGNRRGHVSFAVQLDPKSEPVFVIELAITTSALVKEMSSGLVRIALETEKGRNYGNGSTRPGKLFWEPVWTMYCNGKRCGFATSRAFTESDWHVLSTVKSVSVGAGVIPDGKKGIIISNGSNSSEGELVYMRAKFERVVGSKDSEAFYMLNPDGNGGPELSIFLLRI